MAFGLHPGILARPGFKSWWTLFVPEEIERATYVLVSILYYWIRLRSFMPHRVQVQIGFTAFIAPGLVPGLGLVLWVPLVGTSTQLLFGCCPMALLLDLAAWNCRRPFTFALVWGIATRPPGGEGLLSSRQARDGFSCQRLAVARQSIVTTKR